MRLAAALADPRLLGHEFAGPSRATWRLIARALDGAASFTPDEAATWLRIAGDRAAPRAAVREFYAVAGRRSGKSSFAAAMAVHAAALDYSAHLAAGERAVVALIAADRKQAGVLFRYVRGLLAASAVLAREVVRETADEIELANGNVIEIHTCSFRATRGRTYALVILDEAAFFRSEESANPDIELRRAVLPGLATIPTSRLVVISSPWARRGLVYQMHARHFAHASDAVLVVQAATRDLNPAFDAGVIESAEADDPIAARTEYGAQFREDIAQFLPDELLDAAVVSERRERVPLETLDGGSLAYHAFADMSGGRHDASVLAIAHRDGERSVLDCLRVVVPPFEPAAVVAQFAATLRAYRLASVMGDRYGAEWVVSAFAAAGVAYAPSERDRSTLFLECLPLFAERRVELLDHARLLAELRGLERRPRPGGRDAVTHGPGGHDDVANAACGALWLAARRPADTPTAIWIPSAVYDAYAECGPVLDHSRGSPAPWDVA